MLASPVAWAMRARIFGQSSTARWCPAAAEGSGRVGSCARLPISVFCVLAACACASTRRLLIFQLLDLVFERFALRIRCLAFGALQKLARGIDGADVELARGLAFDADRPRYGTRRHIVDDDRVLAFVELHLGEARHLRTR